MLEELKKKNKNYQSNFSLIHPIENYENLILREINENLKGQGYEKVLEVYETLKGETLEFPLRSIREGVETTTPDFLLVENRLIVNERIKFQNFFKELKNQLRTTGKFYFTISFIRFSGLQLIINELKELEEKGIEGEIITSTYLNITEPKALEKLLEFKNLKIKLYKGNKESFHTKAYIFERENSLGSLIIGSSNLSHEALSNGKEWNLRISEKLEENIYKQGVEEFSKIWNSNESIFLTKEIVEKYNEFYKNQESKNFDNFLEELVEEKKIEPNFMQKQILENLKKLRESNEDKAIVIAATGTGKTYLSAFDVKNFNAKSVLFLAHREELLDNGITTFKKIFPRKKMGKFSQSEKNVDADFIFGTVQSISKEKFMINFHKKKFEYIIIDEFHHAAAEMYKNILDYFEPKFLLGLTATPERMDGKDILSLCDYNIAGEIRLKQALESELLCSFHYFGISDTSVDYEKIRRKNGKFLESELSEKLSVNERTEFIIDKIKLYGFNGEILKAIGFCVDINHAIKMSKNFNLSGFETEYITAKDSMEKRKKVIENFRKGKIQIIFTVDIFNEGVDIPEINMLLFLRPTESSTIFTQQLGRGLRKIKGKDYVTVLDFIGNYNKDFILSNVFLEGKNRLDKNNIKNEVLNEFHNLPNTNYIELDRICQKKVLDNLEKTKLNSTNYIVNEYFSFKEGLGYIPSTLDFIGNEELLKLIVKNYNSYAKFLIKVEKVDFLFDENQLKFFEKIEKKFPIKWAYEFLLLQILIEHEEISLADFIKVFKERFGLEKVEEFHIRLIKNINLELDEEILGFEDEKFILNKKIVLYLENREFKDYLKSFLKFGLIYYKNRINQFDKPLTKYQEYSRVELQYLLESTQERGCWRAGYAISNNDICLFITINKDENIEEHLKYDNFFRGQKIVQWISQSKTSHDSKIGQLFIKHKEMGYKIHIFIRKYSVFLGSAMDFTYMGEAFYKESSGDKPMYILWELENKIPEEIYLDLL